MSTSPSITKYEILGVGADSELKDKTNQFWNENSQSKHEENILIQMAF